MKKNKKIISLLSSLAIMSAMGAMTVNAEDYDPSSWCRLHKSFDCGGHIRDVDMAAEMVRFSNNNILAQAGQAMLAQANQTNQGVLSLLG